MTMGSADGPQGASAVARGRVHMIGIGGAGMSALARLYLDQGIPVSGSDAVASKALDDLCVLGAAVYAGSDPACVAGARLLVYSSAVSEHDPELAEARRLGIPDMKHAKALGDLFNTKRGIAVAGTHGKTTATSMIALILEKCGLAPTFQVGGELVDLGTSAKWGTGEWMVVEADEFDRRFLEYRPEIAVLNNVEPDHFEYYGTYENMRGAFVAFLGQVKPGGTVVAWGQDQRLAGLLDEAGTERVIRFGIEDEAEEETGSTRQRNSMGTLEGAWDYVARNVRFTGERTRFVLERASGGVRVPVTLAVPGRHNLLNALAAMATADTVGVRLEDAAAVLTGFHGARRRFQLLVHAAGIRVYDDYAHHPTAVRVTLTAARRLIHERGRLWAVFQPHLRTRTEQLFEEFSGAFVAADVVLLTDVYSPAGREPEGQYRGSAELAVEMEHRNARHVPTLDAARALLQAELRPGDVVIVMGAGTIERLAGQVAQDVQERAGRYGD